MNIIHFVLLNSQFYMNMNYELGQKNKASFPAHRPGEIFFAS